MRGRKSTTTKKKDTPEKIKCRKCLKDRAPSNFYINNNPLFSSEKLETCKDCINEFIGEKGSKDYLNRVHLVLSLMNKPFLADLWVSRDSDWAKYIPQLSSFPQYKGLTFADSNSEVISKDSKNIKDEDRKESLYVDDNNIIVTQKMRNFWRPFTDEEIPILETYFQDLVAVYECETPIQKTLYRNMAVTQYLADNAKNPTEFDKLMGTLSKLMNDANIKPVQESGATDNGLSTWGEWVKKIEETEPIPEATEEFKDVDNIWKYISKWFIGHFAKVFGLSNDDDQIQKEIDDLKESGD